jgi:hypothetical protein
MSRRIATTTALILAMACGLRAQAPRTEYEIKAAYLFSFGGFVEWPPRGARDEAPYTICVLGTDPFGRVLDSTVADGALHGRKVQARRIGTTRDAMDCRILFISTSEERRVSAIVQALSHADVLTVSDIQGFASRGGMIQFVTAGSRIRFEINLTSARDAGLTMSSELLRVASAVSNNRVAGE